MSFNAIEIQKIDQTGNYHLNELYLLSYTYTDGWTERALRVAFYIDIYFNCKINSSYFIPNYKKNKKTYTKRVEKQIEIKTPIEIKNTITLLLKVDKLQLERCYADTFMENSQTEDFVINHSTISHNVAIGIQLKKKQPINKSETLFFQLHTEIEKWREAIYKKMISEE